MNITAHRLDQTPAGAAAKTRSASRSELSSLVRRRHRSASSEVHVQRRPGLPRCAAFRSGAAVRKDAELVPLWVGKYDPALIAGLADVGVPGT